MEKSPPPKSVTSEALVTTDLSKAMPKRMVHRQVGALLRKNFILKMRSWKCSCCEILLPIILSWLIFQLPGLLGLDFQRTEVIEADPVGSDGFPRAQDFDADFLDDTRRFGIFRRQPTADMGQSCWCKTLAIVAKGVRKNELADDLKTYFENEYQRLEEDVVNASGYNFTYHWQLGDSYVPGFVQGGYGDSDARKIFLTNWAQCGSWNTKTLFRIFEDEDMLQTYIEDEDYGSSVETGSGAERGADPKAWDRLCGAVVLENDVLRDTNPEFKIRLNASIGRTVTWITRTALEDDPRGIERHTDDESARHFYIRNSFLGIQLLVQRFISSRHEAVNATMRSSMSVPGADINDENKSIFKRAWLVPFPVEPYWSSDGLGLISDLTWLVVFAFSASVSVQISRLIREKEMRLREIMRMMGLMDASYYLSWLITQILTWLVICLAISLVMQAGTYKHSSYGLVFLLNITFGLSSMSFAFLMSAIFTRERVGAVIGFFVYLSGLFIPVADYASASTKNFMSLIPIVGFRQGLGVVGYLEETYGGLTADTAGVDYRNYSFVQSVGMNLVAAVLWWVVYYYVDQTNPFQVGFKRPFYFPFQKSYWLECFIGEELFQADDETDNGDTGGDTVPREVLDGAKEALRRAGKCVEISGLCKSFKGPSGETISAVKDLFMAMYEGEIFALLGHNGAGKTTTMGAITGFLAPTSGKVSVIAIMSRGQLKCLGSSSFLKKCYGCGYVLSFVKQQEGKGADAEVVEYLKKRISDKSLLGQVDVVALEERYPVYVGSPEVECRERVFPEGMRFMFHIKVLSSAGQELLVQLPFAAAKDFPGLMDDLDAEVEGQKDELKGLLVAYGVSVTNLEEVFLRVADPHSEEDSVGAVAHAGNPSLSAVVPVDASNEALPATVEDEEDSKVPATVVNIEEDEPVIEPATRTEQTMALIQRRIRFGLRDRKMFVCQLLLPLLLLTGSLALVKQGANERIAPPLIISSSDLNVPLQKAKSPRPWHIIHAGGDADVSPYWSPICTTPDDYCDTLSTVAMPTGQTTELNAMQSHLRNERNAYEASSYIAFTHLDNATDLQRESGDPTEKIVFWHNLTATASSAIALNSYVNAWFAAHGTDVKVTVVNHPLPQTLFEKGISVVVSGILSTIAVIWAFAFIPAGICSYIVMEKEKDVRSQLAISGCSTSAYWLAHFLFDTAFNLVAAVAAIVVFYAFNMEAFTDSDKIGPTIMLLLLFAPSASTTQFSAQTVTIVLNIAVGTIVVIVVSVLQTIPEEFCEDCLVAGNALMWIFRFIPPFALGFGFYRLAIYVSFLGVDPWGSEIFGTCTEKTLGTRSECYGGVADDLVYLALAGVAYLGLCIWLDYLGTKGHWLSYKVKLERKCSVPEDQLAPEDDDVTAEKERVAGLDKRQQILAVDNVRKCYLPRGSLTADPSRAVHAVKGVSFAADSGQVFGLLGVNGAGKTTTFKIMCGLYAPTAGEVWIAGSTVTNDTARCRRNLGYCPQFDALLERMTTKEHLELYGKLKGLKGELLRSSVENTLKQLSLEPYKDKRAGSLSGGNKRKLSVGMAIIGRPRIVFLDEPSTGMDPVSRRFLWGVIQQLATHRKSVVVLTTHSMEEAEALCSRIAIQVGGQFRCLGSPQRLKTRFGKGYEVSLKYESVTDEASDDMRSEYIAFGYGVESVTGIESWGIASSSDGSSDSTLTQLSVEDVRAILDKVPDRLARASSLPGAVLRAADEQGSSAVLVSDVISWVDLDEKLVKLEAFLKASGIGSSVLLERHGTNVKYALVPEGFDGEGQKTGTSSMRIGEIFGLFLDAQEKLHFNDFQISQTTLERIFNAFAMGAVSV
ncbi:hypothetical protein FOL47_009036 [Perkinsus chesapeaki]|uniref:ABC transporter domain-containing protein n=1 Tax=Perkinsus chesapeaki TaxID=330153 RepID=A0A7J6LAN6_PERCH|nr:hypothetical protein FOL47_009036 [Perkinsus chesapeaki]